MTANSSSPPSGPESQKLHLTDEEKGIVVALLTQHLPDREVWAFGSRVSGRNLKPFSDLDLAITGTGRLAASDLEQLYSAFAESDLPFRVDLVELGGVDETFRRHIEAEHLALTHRR